MRNISGGFIDADNDCFVTYHDAIAKIAGVLDAAKENCLLEFLPKLSEGELHDDMRKFLLGLLGAWRGLWAEVLTENATPVSVGNWFATSKGGRENLTSITLKAKSSPMYGHLVYLVRGVEQCSSVSTALASIHNIIAGSMQLNLARSKAVRKACSVGFIPNPIL